MIALFCYLVVAHLLCDFPLQGDFLARAKNHRNPLPGVPWFTCLLVHAGIQAAGVYFVTRSLPCAAGELVCHVLIDYAKSENLFGFNFDQACHILCKLAWVAMVATSRMIS